MQAKASAAGMQPDLTIVIVSWNTKTLLHDCLYSIRSGAVLIRAEVYVVDNNSADGSPAMVRAEFPEVHLIQNRENIGFSKANNQTWQYAQGRYWMLLNSDTVVKTGALDKLVAFMDAHPRAGLTTAKLINQDGTPQYCAQPIPGILNTIFQASRLHKLLPPSIRGRVLLRAYWTYDQPIQLGSTWGTALVARREAVAEVGLLPEDFFMYGEDLEWCLRMRRHGWQVWFCAEAEVLHYGMQSTKQRWSDADQVRVVQNGNYKAFEKHKGRAYVVALQLTMLVALGLEWLASKIRGRLDPQVPALLHYHWQTLKRVTQR